MNPIDEFGYVALIFGLFVVPRLLERVYIPSGITAFLLGAISVAVFGLFKDDSSIALLAALGINSLFLFAGLEANLEEIWSSRRAIALHVVSRGVVMLLAAAAIYFTFGLPPIVSILYALALVTPSAGFILDSIQSLPLSEEGKFWVKSKAIATELLALALMFVLLQAHSARALALSSLGMILMLVAMPVLFRLVSRMLTPYAEHSEFGFFLTLAVLAGILTKKLGAYYLVGAFIVGLSVQRFRSLFPRMDVDQLLHALKLFSAFFVPFYFFRAGSRVSVDHFSVSAVGLGLGLAIVVSALRLGSVAFSRWRAFGESFSASKPIALALMPTLVFGLVIAGILRDVYGLPSIYFGALIVYTVVVTVLPGFILRNTRIQDVHEPFELVDRPSAVKA
ncbi:MAG: cation:proton antiporter [Bacteriovoracia bacterium]